MILSSAEVAALAHVPSAAIASRSLLRLSRATKSAPGIAVGHDLILGENRTSGRSQVVSLSEEQRTKHVYVIGASGTGKSTFLLSLIAQDLKADRGIAVLDPHGDLIDDVLARIPTERV